MNTCKICGEPFEPAKPRQRVCAVCKKGRLAITSRNHYERTRDQPTGLRDCPDADGEIDDISIDDVYRIVEAMFDNAWQMKDFAWLRGQEAQFYMDTVGVRVEDLALENCYQLNLA